MKSLPVAGDKFYMVVAGDGIRFWAEVLEASPGGVTFTVMQAGAICQAPEEVEKAIKEDSSRADCTSRALPLLRRRDESVGRRGIFPKRRLRVIRSKDLVWQVLRMRGLRYRVGRRP
jgi:hypothetical protein